MLTALIFNYLRKFIAEITAAIFTAVIITIIYIPNISRCVFSSTDTGRPGYREEHNVVAPSHNI